MKLFLALIGLVLSITGCTAVGTTISEHVTAREETISATQRHANIVMEVWFDESASGYSLHIGEQIAKYPDEIVHYRRVRVKTANATGGYFLGTVGFVSNTVLVPDGMPILKTGDVVEVRYPKQYGHGASFLQDGESAAILRLLCAHGETRAQHDSFKACWSQLPKAPGWESRGLLGALAAASPTRYMEHLRDTGLTFTPYYDDKGKPLSSAVPPAPAPTKLDAPAVYTPANLIE